MGCGTSMAMSSWNGPDLYFCYLLISSERAKVYMSLADEEGYGSTGRLADWREERRKHAWKWKRQGWRQKERAEALGGSEGAGSQWAKAAKERGEEALTAHPPKGGKPCVWEEQKAHIPDLLAKGAEASGFRGDVWTAKRVAKGIEKTF